MMSAIIEVLGRLDYDTLVLIECVRHYLCFIDHLGFIALSEALVHLQQHEETPEAIFEIIHPSNPI